jgi:hypothetical protein
MNRLIDEEILSYCAFKTGFEIFTQRRFALRVRMKHELMNGYMALGYDQGAVKH